MASSRVEPKNLRRPSLRKPFKNTARPQMGANSGERRFWVGGHRAERMLESAARPQMGANSWEHPVFFGGGGGGKRAQRILESAARP